MREREREKEKDKTWYAKLIWDLNTTWSVMEECRLVQIFNHSNNMYTYYSPCHETYPSTCKLYTMRKLPIIANRQTKCTYE